MSPFPTPQPPDFKLDWDWFLQFDWIRALYDCPQDPVYHAEGDVGIHTKMVCEALIALPEWQLLPSDERELVFASAILHDVSKPETTRVEPDGHIGAPNHSPKGAIRSRGILYQLGAPLAFREQVASLIRNHQQPFHLFKKENVERHVVKMSLSTNLEHLYCLTTADNTGRVSVNQKETFENIQLFRELALELAVFGRKAPFANVFTRFNFCRDAQIHYSADLFDDSKSHVIMVCGLPGSGKDTYIRRAYPQLPVISLDAIREEIQLPANGDQKIVIRLAKERAKEYLRAHQSFIYNATSTVKRLRDEWVDLFVSYKASVSMLYLDVSRQKLLEQNQARDRVVPEHAIEGMIEKWEVPDLTEAHIVRWVEDGKEHGRPESL